MSWLRENLVFILMNHPVIGIMKTTKLDVKSFSSSGEKLETGRSALGKRIRAAREAGNDTRNTAAELFEIAVATLSAWELGQREPDATKLGQIARHYGVRLNWLIFGEEPMREGDLARQLHALPRATVYADVVNQDPEGPRKDQPPPLVDSQPEKLDSKAMWGCIQAVAMLQQGLGLQPSEVADYAMRMYRIAMASDMEGYEAVQYAVQQIREGIEYRTKQ